MTHLRAGDEVVCINDDPMGVMIGDDYWERESGLVRGQVYVVADVIPLPSAMMNLTRPATALLVIRGVTSPLVEFGGENGFHPARFRKAIRTGRAAAVADLMKACGVADRPEEVAA